MPARPSYLSTESWNRAQDLSFSDKVAADIHALTFPQMVSDGIDGLKQFGESMMRQSSEPQPLPIVVSDRPQLNPVASEQVIPSTPSGTPAAMPSNTPRPTVDATITTGPRPGQTLQPGESVGSVTLAGGNFTPEEQAAIQQAAQEEGVPADLIAAIWDTEQSGSGSVSDAGARGRGQVVPGQGYDLPGEDPTIPLHGARQTARALKDKYNNTGSWDEAGAAYFGYGTDSGGMDTNTYRDLVRQNRSKYQQATPGSPQAQQQRSGPMPEDAPNGGRQTADLYPRQDLLDDPDKWAVCGPLGIMAFAAMKGQPIDYQTAKEAARKAGWTPQSGMAGPESQVAALNSIGVPSKTGPIDVDLIAREVRNGNPVGLSSPGGEGHYFTVQGVDDQGRLDLGNSALSLRASGGRRWFTIDELRQMGAIGNVTTAIYVDNPASPTPSVAADARQSLNAGSPPATQAPAGAVPPASGSPDNALWSPDRQASPDMPSTTFQAAIGRSGGAGIMQRAPLADEQPYDPRQADQGPHEAAPPVYADPTISDPSYTGGAPSGDVGVAAGSVPASAGSPPANVSGVNPSGTTGAPNIVLQDGRTVPPTPGGAWEPVSNLTQPQSDTRSADQGPHESPPQQPSGMKPVWDALGNIVGYVQDRASNLVERITDPKPMQGQSEADRRLIESARSIGQPLTSGVNDLVSQAEQAMGVPEGTFLQAAQDVSGVLGPEEAIQAARTATRAARAAVPEAETGLRGAMHAPNTSNAAGVADNVIAQQAAHVSPGAVERAAEPSAAAVPFSDISRQINSPERAVALETAVEEARQRFMQGLPPRSQEEQLLTEQYGRRWSDIQPTEQPRGSRQAIGEAVHPVERGSQADVEAARRMPDYQPQSISLNTSPGASASAGLVGDLGNAVSGGVTGAAAGAGLPADTPEERRRNALIGAGGGMVAGPVVGRLLPRAEGAMATLGAGPNKPVASPSQSANPNIRNVARMMGGNYKPVGESRSIGEILSAALTDRWAIHANVPKEARARIKAAGGTAPVERLAERIEVNGPTIAHQRTVDEIAPALQSVGKDDEWLAQVLVHRHNLDIAKEKAQEVYDAAIAAGQSPARAQARADRVRTSRQFSGGMTEQDITQALVDVQTEIGPARFKKVTDAAQAFWDSGKENLQRKLDEGIIDQTTYNTLTQKYPHYVRTDIADYAEKGPANPSPGGKALGIGNNGIKPLSIEGTSKDRVNPILSTIDSIYGTESAITRNAAARDLIASRDADPTMAGLFREVAPDAQAYRGNQQTMVPPDYTLHGGEEKLTHWDQGVARQFVIPKEYNQLLSPTPGALLGDNAGPLRAFYSLIRGQLTTHNPGLQYVTSPLRDLRDAAIGMQTSAGAAAKRTGASLPENVVREAAGSVAALPEAVGRLAQALPQVAEGFFSNTYGPRVAELRRAGMGFNPRPSPEYRGKLPRWLANPQDTRAAMEDLQRTGGLQVNGKADVARIIRNSLSLYAERVGNRIEMLPRVAAANMERGRGGDMLSQVVTGQNATVSFLKGGWLTRQVNAVDPFLNTTVQSGAQNARLYRKSPAAFTAALITTVGVPAMLAEAWNRSDPERAKAYEDRPEYLKNTGIIWELPGVPPGTGALGEKMPNFLWEPLGNFGWAGMAAREALGIADKATGLIPPTETAGNDRSDPMYWAQRGADILSMFSPVKGGDAGSAVASLLPPVASEEVDLAANRDLFRGSTIKTDRADERASNLAKTITTGVNAVTGAETRPSEWEHRLQPAGYAGQLARGASDIGRERDQTRPIQDIPGVGPLASRIIRDSGGQRLQDERDVATAIPSVRQALRDAGLRADELVLPGSNIKDMPITRQEQAAAQRDFNALLDQKVKEALADPDWKTSSTFEREGWLKRLATRARNEAGGNVVNRWDEPTYDFRTDKRVQKRTGS